jgi:hypothetical protein
MYDKNSYGDISRRNLLKTSFFSSYPKQNLILETC